MFKDYAGDVKVKILDEEMILRPSFEALAAIESEGKPIISILSSFGTGEVFLTDMTNVFYYCLKAFYGLNFVMTKNDVGEAILAQGLNNDGLQTACIKALNSLVAGDDERKKKAIEILKAKL